MAMIKCPECGRDISSLAATCPQCGYQITRKATIPNGPAIADAVASGTASFIAGLIAFFALVASIWMTWNIIAPGDQSIRLAQIEQYVETRKSMVARGMLSQEAADAQIAEIFDRERRNADDRSWIWMLAASYGTAGGVAYLSYRWRKQAVRSAGKAPE